MHSIDAEQIKNKQLINLFLEVNRDDLSQFSKDSSNHIDAEHVDQFIATHIIEMIFLAILNSKSFSINLAFANGDCKQFSALDTENKKLLQIWIEKYKIIQWTLDDSWQHSVL